MIVSGSLQIAGINWFSLITIFLKREIDMKKMNRKFIAGTAFAVSAAAAISACGMPTPNVYGPVPSETVESTEEVTSETTTAETTVAETGVEETAETTINETTDNYKPEDNLEEAVYGPPEWFEENAFDPGSEVQEDVYGPPEWFE